jgi:hypothetical protein
MRIMGNKEEFPLARSQGLLVEEVDSEKVVFDSESKQAHCLTPLAAVVFGNCDGETSSTELARIASGQLAGPVDQAQVEDALAQLAERGLLASASPSGISRREMVRKGAVAGAAAAAAASLIFTVDPPVAQAAAVCDTINCSRSSQCPSASGNGCANDLVCNNCNTFLSRCGCGPPV